ncbi:type II toxin-antitoxin system PemK/MazF family toxin [Weissella diestrammenae]|uniref:mRNA interferase n=1 Tax=Weissella diestrammenae TaxID=1162633 RepID=A0A7G9T6M2_9LACO|nr:type II toxin-antitoxin system PemK/MazF family toxin [Weissella diestrammenae]MCM0582972.1 type II toxin-antitoxin system PemK/MazF family toxin [Weissella diestrammenae]QNN75747.1 type II toxin-antitoxin system PemK/MazF family toxin [Weissella diestrammenae]
MEKVRKEIHRGDIWYANLEFGKVGSEQGGVRPVLIIQNDIGNLYAPTTIIAPISTKELKKLQPTHVKLPGTVSGTGVNRDSTILMEQIRVVDKNRIQDKIGRLPDTMLKATDRALLISLGLNDIGQG